MRLLIKNGRVIDPSTNLDEIKDILVEDGKIVSINKNIEIQGDRVIDAENHWVVPGLIDVHVHLREPGFEYKETIETGSNSGAKGGFTTICCMPNTSPVMDNIETIEYIKEKVNKDSLIHVLPIGAITKGQTGKELGNIEEMVRAGICAISEDGKTVLNSGLMEEALKIAAKLNISVLSHCEDHYLVSEGGSMNQGERSKLLNIKGISPESEEVIVSRDMILAKGAGAKLNICHISTKGSVELVRDAKRKGQKVWAEVTPHHFTLTDKAVEAHNTNTKMNPPLRGELDVQSIIEGLRDGTIDIIATDHAPHHARDKEVSFERAAFGIVGLETSVALGITELVHKGVLSPMELIAKMTINPAQMLGIDKGTLKVGSMADITIIDPNLEYEININEFASKSKNSPFHGRRVRGKPIYTIVKGKIVLDNGRLIKGGC